jgi:histone acetyltransferase (RNA polymerase elongator complex component)
MFLATNGNNVWTASLLCIHPWNWLLKYTGLFLVFHLMPALFGKPFYRVSRHLNKLSLFAYPVTAAFYPSLLFSDAKHAFPTPI